MRASWTALHLEMVRYCNRLSSERAFGLIRGRLPALGALGSIADLIQHQQTPGGDPVRRNGVLRALIIEAQADGPSAELASTVLILALWPGLDAVRFRLCRDFPGSRAEIGSDILAQIAIGVRRLDLEAVNRIAATLVMNVERDIRRKIVGDRDIARAEVSITSPKGSVALVVSLPDDPSVPLSDLRAALEELLGRDADFFLRIIVLGETQQEAGRALGLTHEAARKRHQRGMTKLHAAQRNRADLSHSAARLGFYPSVTRNRGGGKET